MDELKEPRWQYWKLYRYERPARYPAPNPRQGLLVNALSDEGTARWVEIAPLPSRSTETLESCIKGWLAFCEGVAWEQSIKKSAALTFACHSLWKLRRISTPIKICGLLYDHDPSAIEKAIQRSVELGFSHIKIKASHWSAADLLTLLGSLSPSIKIRIDFNHQWRSGNFIKFLDKINREQIDFLEDPPEPKAAELFGLAWATDAPSISQGKIKVWKPTIETAPCAQKYHQIILSSSYESQIGLSWIAALASGYSTAPVGIDTEQLMEDDLFEGPLVIKQGCLQPTTPRINIQSSTLQFLHSGSFHAALPPLSTSDRNTYENSRYRSASLC